MNAHTHTLPVVSFAAVLFLLSAGPSVAQSSTYYLHAENGSNFGTFALKTAAPDAATVVRQSADFKGFNGPLLQQGMGLWTTLVGDPQRTGIIPAQSVVTFTLWMRKTSAYGVVYPYASAATVETLDVNFQPKQSLCATTGAAALDTTLRPYTFSCSTGSVPVASVDRFAVSAGFSMTQVPGHKSMKVELQFEGTSPSSAVLPLPVPPPSIASLSPAAGLVGQAVIVSGANFGTTQNQSVVSFNGVPASVTSWSSGAITAVVPAGATTGLLVVTVGGQTSNGVIFTVITPPSITSLNPSSAAVGEAVTINGANFEPTQGTSTVQFSGTVATATSWSDTSITTVVAAGATTGPVVVTVNGNASNAMPFIVVVSPSITALQPASGIVTQPFTISGAGFGATQGSSTVTLNGFAATPTTWSDTIIGTSVPSGATSGPVVVTVAGRASNPVPFTVIGPPVLTSLDPNAGSPGETVTIQGENLGPGNPAVTFNGVQAAITGATMTAVTVTVPPLATTGPVVLTVNGLTSNDLPFTVSTTTQPATLMVQTFLLDETAPDGVGAPAGAGVYIKVNGEVVGQTTSDGRLTVSVAAGDEHVTATMPSISWGEASITLGPGSSGSVSIVLEDSKDVAESTDLALMEAADAIIPITSATFTLEFVRDGAMVPMTRVSAVELLDHEGNVTYELGDMFTVTDGAIAAVEAQNLFLWLPWSEGAVLRVDGIDAEGFTHSNVARFSVGQYTLSLTLAAPPSNPALSVSNIDVAVSVVGTAITLHRTSDVDGHIVIPALPYAPLAFESATQAGIFYYYGRATLSHTSDTSATLVMRNAVDVINGVPPLTVGPGGQGAALSSAASPVQSALQAAERDAIEQRLIAGVTSNLQNVITASDPGLTATISVVSNWADEPVEQSAVLNVPQGTDKLTLKYNVISLEYPEWVRKQSPFDDVWSLTVFGGAGGQQLFQTTRNVNSQESGDPTWQMDSSTGEIEQEIDVQALAAQQDVQLVLFGTSVNIRDRFYATTVNATLGAQPALTINDVKKDLVVPTKGDSTFYSIPRPSANNTYARWFTLRVSKPKDATITNVRLTLKDSAGGTLQTLLNEGPGANVKLFEGGERIEVRATMHSVTSSVPSTPPTTHFIRYEFVVEGTLNGNTITSEPKSASEMNALWRMPDGFARYSIREPGGDDWASRGAYDWLTKHRALITKINDVSGEHARDIGHTSHARGVDIDMYHFYTFSGAVSGFDNYDKLRGDVVLALNGDTAAKGRVTDWVSATRTGIEALIALADVRIVLYSKGSMWTQSGISLAVGWAETLVKDGTLTASGKTLNTGAGAWSKATSTKHSFREDHNDHVHIALDSTLLIK